MGFGKGGCLGKLGWGASLYKRLRFSIILLSVATTVTQPAQLTERGQVEQVVTGVLKSLKDDVQATIYTANQALALAHSSNKTAIDGFEKIELTKALAKEVETGLRRVEALLVQVTPQAQMAVTNLGQEYERLTSVLAQDVVNAKNIVADAAKVERERALEDKMRLAQEERESGILQKVAIAGEQEKWRNIKEILANPQPLVTIGLAVVTVALGIYAIKYGVPLLIDYFSQPRVISETSQRGWFQWFTSDKHEHLDDLVFAPSLQAQLADLLLRIQTAKTYDHPLPNILFYGPSGTGKTAFVKALAYASGLDYALTSGSEFTKITDLNCANNELRALLTWAKKSKKGLIVFIDEAELLFEHRKLPTASKMAHDFTNTFLSLISDQSQKNVLFIFATNHPFKLDDAVINRIGTSIEFALPIAAEREKILSMYLVKGAQEHNNVAVGLPQDVVALLPTYAQRLEGFSPRAIKFIAQEMIIKAQQNPSKQLTDDIAQSVIDLAKDSLDKIQQWEKERATWIATLSSINRGLYGSERLVV